MNGYKKLGRNWLMLMALSCIVIYGSHFSTTELQMIHFSWFIKCSNNLWNETAFWHNTEVIYR